MRTQHRPSLNHFLEYSTSHHLKCCCLYPAIHWCDVVDNGTRESGGNCWLYCWQLHVLMKAPSLYFCFKLEMVVMGFVSLHLMLVDRKICPYFTTCGDGLKLMVCNLLVSSIWLAPHAQSLSFYPFFQLEFQFLKTSDITESDNIKNVAIKSQFPLYPKVYVSGCQFTMACNHLLLLLLCSSHWSESSTHVHNGFSEPLIYILTKNKKLLSPTSHNACVTYHTCLPVCKTFMLIRNFGSKYLFIPWRFGVSKDSSSWLRVLVSSISIGTCIDVTARFATQPVSKPAAGFEVGRPASKRASRLCDRTKIMARFETGWLDGFKTGSVDTYATVTGQLICRSAYVPNSCLPNLRIVGSLANLFADCSNR